jgi:hypothetical protein
MTFAAARRTGRLYAGVNWWLSERARDVVRWPVEVLRQAPARSTRLAATLAGGPSKPLGLWLAVATVRALDLAGLPEVAEAVVRATTRATPLEPAEAAAAASVMGPDAVRWHEVRVAEGGVLRIAFHFNKQRAFTLWHTINLPSKGNHTRANMGILVHELVHVYQYEQLGSAYLPEAVHAQHMPEGYDYGKELGLLRDRSDGKRFCDYNREQQAQIVQDFYDALHGRDAGDATRGSTALACYRPFIGEMQLGLL